MKKLMKLSCDKKLLGPNDRAPENPLWAGIPDPFPIDPNEGIIPIPFQAVALKLPEIPAGTLMRVEQYPGSCRGYKECIQQDLAAKSNLTPNEREYILQLHEEMLKVADLLPIGTHVRCHAPGKWRIHGEKEWIVLSLSFSQWCSILQGPSNEEHERQLMDALR